MRFLSILLAVSAAALSASGAVVSDIHDLESRQSATDRLVFCHFMIGIMSDRNSVSDYDGDMQRAKAYGIDAFALNIGVDPYTNAQLDLAYQSAANNGMKVFISFDFNWWNTGQAYQIGQLVASYGVRPAQLKVGGSVFVSSFAGDGLDVATMKQAAGMPVFFAPNFHPGQGNFGTIDGALNWLGWPNNGRNKAPDGSGNVSVAQGDQSYLSALGGKPYIAPVSPWFFTHYGPEVSYSKNWVFPGDLLWWDRWNQILNLNAQYLEIVTWNDYGESHYVGPLSSKHQDDGASKWVNDMPHDAFLDMAKPFIAAFKARSTSVANFIKQDQIIYWYRVNMEGLNCDSTDTTMVGANNGSGNYFMGRPYGWQTMSDSVFVVTLLTAPGTLTVSSGGKAYSYNAPAGASAYTVPMGVGQQSFALARGGKNVLAANSLRDITNVCNCGIYNFNPYTGSVPPSFVDPMHPDGLNSLTQGLHVSTCFPSASLPTSAPPYTGPGGNPTTVTTTTTMKTTTTNPPTTTTTKSSGPTTTTTSKPTSPPTTTTKATTTTTTTRNSGGGCTITASDQIRPTNCLQPGCVWAGPPGSDSPDHCDGSHRRRGYY